MGNYNYSSSIYGLERQQRRDEWEQAPKECPHCRLRQEHTPINQHYSEYGTDRPRYHCGKDRCRQAASRSNKAERLKQERKETRARILQYCEQHLDRDQKHAVMSMCDMLMEFSKDEGHQIAEQVIQVIDAKRCKHDRISVLLDNASAAKRRADKAEEHNQQLERLYKERIQELEGEIQVYQLLENAIHGIAQRQRQKQPEEGDRPTLVTEPEETDPDRARVLAVLAQANIKPYTGQEELDQ